MPLTAESRSSDTTGEWELIDITDFEAPRMQLAGHELRCPDCKSGVHVVQSVIRIAHFAHNPDPSGRRPCAIKSSESMQHIVSKIHVSDRLKAIPAYKGAKIIKEHWLADVKRRADIFVEYPDGCTEVHEIQLAAITIDQLEERTNDYKDAGVDEIVWWFGEKANVQNNTIWAKERLGSYGILSITNSQERVV